MGKTPRRIEPRTFFLNERQQLRAVERKGRGALPKLGNIDWARRGQRIKTSLDNVKASVKDSKDPLRGTRFFVVAQPVEDLPKYRDIKGEREEYSERPNFRSKAYSQVFGRLGLDLVGMTSDGNAVVHASPSRFEELIVESGLLPGAGARNHARWSAIDAFQLVPAHERLDFNWVRTCRAGDPIDIVFEAQPLLTRAEGDTVLRTVSGYKSTRQERITGTGQDYSGRQWARGMMLAENLERIAGDLSSLQSIHPPLYAKAATSVPQVGSAGRVGASVALNPTLPTVAIFDNGIPAGHVILSAFSRGGQVVPRGAAANYLGHHGSQVASRIVFGEIEGDGVLPEAECRFLDVRVSNDEELFDPKVIMDALAAVVAAYPDVRVYNLSINTSQPFQALDSESKKEWFRALRDLENFAFENDRALVFAAGNTDPRQMPAPPYPNHVGDGRWGMGFWSCGFNSWGCGAYVGHPTQGGLGDPDWPSPFTRMGPGVCGCPVPGFSAPGGNFDTHHEMLDGMGELVCDANGQWGESVGTSLAAPLLAREVAKTIKRLTARCPPGVIPYVCMAKAFLTLTAKGRNVPQHVQALAACTLGNGRASSERLARASEGSAVFLWQGEMASSDEKLRVVLPLPSSWVNAAAAPYLRLIACWETPVNDANSEVWACRKVDVQLRPGLADGLRAATGTQRPHATYPLIDRRFDLRKVLDGAEAEGDSWLLEVSYSEQQMAEYFPTMASGAPQRVGLAIELIDTAAEPLDPQLYVQELEIAPLLDRLAILRTAVRAPIRIGL